jgi:3-oxoacyl-(acyl-carrier-protein) synthase
VSRRWVVTAAGTVTAAGDDPRLVFDALGAGRRVAEDGGAGFPSRPIAGFDPARHVRGKRLGLLSRTSQLACAAAALAGEALHGLDGADVGVVLGSAWASLDSVVRFEREACTEGPRLVDPVLFTETVANVPAGHVSIFHGWSALNATVAAGTGSGLEALRLAVQFLDEGRARAIVAGGGDERNEHLLRALHAERPAAAGGIPLTPPLAGSVGGEGACLLVLEDERQAARRGVPALAVWLAGAGALVEPGAAPEEPLRELLDRAALAPRDVDLVVLSASGEAARDRAEVEALLRVFGPQGPPAIVPKALLGETWAAAGPLGVAIACECMRRSLVPAVPPDVRPGPGCEGANLVRAPLRRRVANAIVVDCAESGIFTGVAVAAPGRADG